MTSFRMLCTWLGVGLLSLLPLAQADPRSLASSADDPEQAVLSRLSQAFNRVAQIAKPGVVSLRVQGGDRSASTRREAENFLRGFLEDRLTREELDALLREFRAQPTPTDRLRLLGERLEGRLDPGERQALYWRLRIMEQNPPGSGSGFIIDAEGHVLTNYHVVEGRTTIIAQLADGRELDATIVGTDRETDLALLKIDAKDLTPLRLGDSDQLKVGDWVIAVGAPFGLEQTVTHGIVSALGRRQVRGLDITYQNFIQTDAPVNPGNSGGPLLNLRGEVVGVNTAIASPGTGVNAGVAFTIPSNMALRVAGQLKVAGRVERGFLGVQPLDLAPGDDQVFGLPSSQGVWIDAVTPDSPAEQGGLRVEDIVISVNGVAVRDRTHFFELIADLVPNQTAEIEVVRERSPRKLSIRVGRRADLVTFPRERLENLALPLEPLGMFGYSMRPGLSDLYEKNQRGVVILRANPERTRAIRERDLVVACDGVPVRSVFELQQALAARRQSRVELRILEASGDERLVTVSLER